MRGHVPNNTSGITSVVLTLDGSQGERGKKKFGLGTIFELGFPADPLLGWVAIHYYTVSVVVGAQMWIWTALLDSTLVLTHAGTLYCITVY